MGGWLASAIKGYTDAGGNPVGIIGIPRSCHIWSDLNGQEWIAIGTGPKLYLITLGQLYDITPLRLQTVLGTGAAATISGSAVVTITAPLSGAQNGDYVNFTNFTPFNGINLNGQYLIFNSTANTYQVTAYTIATGTGTGGGAFTATYDITAGLDNPGFYYGWGSGVWGQGTWGTPRGTPKQSTTVGGTPYVAGSGSGTIIINGTPTGTITLTGVEATDLTAVAAAINAISGTTGVQAVYSPNSGTIVLSNTTGNNIVIAYTGALTPASTGVAAAGTYLTQYLGMVQPLRLWWMDNWGQSLMCGIRNGSTYYWDRNTGPQSRAVAISVNPQYPNNPGAPVNSLWGLVSNTNQQLVTLGSSHDGINDALYIAISDIDDYTNFTPESTNSAYTGRLSSGSKIVTGIKTRTGMLIMTDTSAFLLAPNASTVFSSQQIADETTILSPNSFIDVNGTCYGMGLRKWYEYDGVFRELPSDVWSFVWGKTPAFPGINTGLFDKVFTWHNDQWSEVWWFYVSAAGTEIDSYVIFNYKDKHWSFGSLSRTTACRTSNYYGFPLAFDSGGNLYEHENGVDNNGSPMTSYVTTYDIQTVQRTPYGAITPSRGLAYNEGAEQIHIHQVVPDIIYQTGPMTLTIKTKRYPQGAYTTKGPYPIVPAPIGTAAPESGAIVCVRARGKLANFTYGSTALGADWRVGNFTFLTSDDGER